eukprot:COSAG02_NODE_62016_length_267_cov_0.607143_1_plen_56_part_01
MIIMEIETSSVLVNNGRLLDLVCHHGCTWQIVLVLFAVEMTNWLSSGRSFELRSSS